MRSAGQPGQVGEGSVLGLAGLAVTLTQQDGRWRASVGDDSHIHAPIESRYPRHVNGKSAILHDRKYNEYRVFSTA